MACSICSDACSTLQLQCNPDRLIRTYGTLMAELHEAVGMGVHAVELMPDTLAQRAREASGGVEALCSHVENVWKRVNKDVHDQT